MAEQELHTRTDVELILHGSWSAGEFFVWGESCTPAAGHPGRRPQVPHHPYAAAPDQLLHALSEIAPLCTWADLASPSRRTILLPSTTQSPLLPSWLVLDLEAQGETDVEAKLAPWQVEGWALASTSALEFLIALPPGRSSHHRYGNDLRFWALVAKLGLEILASHQYVPGIEPDDDRYHARWVPVLDAPQDRARLRALSQAMPPACRALFVKGQTPQADQAPASHTLMSQYLDRLIDQAVRDWGITHLDRRRKSPAGIAGEWWSALWSEDDQVRVAPSQQRELEHLVQEWRRWMSQLGTGQEAAFRLCFRMEAPEVDPETGQLLGADWTLRYMLQANDDPSLLVTADQVWAAKGGSLQYLNFKFPNAQERFLAELGRAARIFPPILDSLRTARPQSCPLTVDEAYAFLREVGPLLNNSGFGVMVPPWWNKPGARLGLRAKLKSPAKETGKGILTLKTLVEFDWKLALGDQELTRQELERLAALKMPLVQIRGQWVLLQPQEVEAAIAFWEQKRRHGQMNLHDALGMALGATDEVEGLPVDGIETTGWLDELLQHLAGRERLQELPPPIGFVGQLRPYQERGFAWLAFLRRWGLGACLADDMGLGKTIQAIALMLQSHRQNGRAAAPSLVICPTSVVGNWKREIQRFAPTLRVMIHHGSDRRRGDEFTVAAQQHDIIISTYGLARRDIDDMEQVTWSNVFLDEAQNIKNPHAKQTRAIRKLQTANRVALTGTPVENRLAELWSIMQFLNPGLLGSEAGFRKQFALPVERYQDRDAAERLKKLVSPFVLRRVKTDPAIIQDLPEKNEMKVYCNMTTEQTTLYEAVVRDTLQQVEAAEEQSMQRRGIVLGMLTRLKQVCNHPAQFLGDGSALPERSGKLERLAEMLEEALSVGDRALVFTQFAEMGHMLHSYLQAVFGTQVLFLHGGTSQKQRDRMVARFQSQEGGPPIFVLSLKAGGTGLNLTAANHVFHYDRWWNPAVENQATDRAFRIGQTRDVQVHKFICAGTLEERIDDLIESKKALADSIVGAGESWLTELSTDQLREIIVLQKE
jgi:SNF2 family DNA or RNA helicase